MPCFDNNQMAVRPSPATAMHVQDYSYVSCSLVMYQDGGGGGVSSGVENGSSCTSKRFNNGGGGGGGGTDDFDDDDDDDDDDDNSSWSEEYALSYAGTSVSSSNSGDGGSSSSSSGSGGEDGRSSSSSSGNGNGDNGSAKNDNNNSKTNGGGRSKWLKSLWTIIDRMDGDRKNKGPRRAGDGKRSPQPAAVKTILRPPTTYKFVIGMSGFPSKVPVYPKRM